MLLQPDISTFFTEISAIGIRLLVTILLTFLLGQLYRWFARDYDSLKPYVRTVIPLAIIMTLLASIISANLAVAIGFVGSLAVIRFRLRTDNSEILIFLLLGLGLGIASGMGQIPLAILAGALIGVILAIYRWLNPPTQEIILQLRCQKGRGDALLVWLKEKILDFELESFSSSNDYDRMRLRFKVPDNLFLPELYGGLRSTEPSAIVKLVEEEGRNRINE